MKRLAKSNKKPQATIPGVLYAPRYGRCLLLEGWAGLVTNLREVTPAFFSALEEDHDPSPTDTLTP